MSGSMLPVALYGLEVPAGEIMIPAANEFPATVSFTTVFSSAAARCYSSLRVTPVPITRYGFVINML